MTEVKPKKIKPDIRAITKLSAARAVISCKVNRNWRLIPNWRKKHTKLSPPARIITARSEGVQPLRKAVAEKIKTYNNIEVDIEAKKPELLVTPGGTGALVGIAQSYLNGKSALVFEPYYPYHRRIIEEFGGKTETFNLDENLSFEKDALLKRCKELKDRAEFPLKMIIVCTPANP